MQIKEIYQKLHEFAVAATGFDASKVIFANQISNARPLKPFITISASSFRNIGTPIEKKVTDAGVMKTVISMVFNASFQAFSDVNHEAEELLNELQAKFVTELANEIFQGRMAPLRTIKHVSAIPSAMNEQIESRAILEREIGFVKLVEQQISLIENVEMQANIGNQNIDLKINIKEN